jgi:hypothetical protein
MLSKIKPLKKNLAGVKLEPPPTTYSGFQWFDAKISNIFSLSNPIFNG